MERINPFMVLPEAGEILDFNDIFGATFGDASTVKRYFGRSGRREENPEAICIKFRTPNHTEVSVGFQAHGGSILQMLGGNRDLIISDHPYATKGEEGNVKESSYPYGADATTFVSADGKDPRGATKGTQYKVDGEGLAVFDKPPRADGGLRPNTDYYATLRRTGNIPSKLPPLTLVYLGTDEPESGGEVLITPAMIPAEGVAGIPMSFNGIPGTFVPTN